MASNQRPSSHGVQKNNGCWQLACTAPGRIYRQRDHVFSKIVSERAAGHDPTDQFGTGIHPDPGMAIQVIVSLGIRPVGFAGSI